jgi:hypothetical protein
MKEFNWGTATEEEVDAYIKKHDELTRVFLESLKVPLENLTEPQEGGNFDIIADQIEKAAPFPSAALKGIRMFGRRNGQLREQKKGVNPDA